MRVEILFHTSSTPKVVEAQAVYTKGALLCIELDDNKTILKYPLCNVFSVAHEHGDHMGTSKDVRKDG
jgi:hypothetical protein